MSLVVGGMYWSHQDDTLLRVCHSSWVAHTGVVVVICSCMYATCHGWYTLEAYYDAHAHMSLVVGDMYWRWGLVKNYSTYVTKYKFPSLPQMYLIKNPLSQNLGFYIFGTKDLSKEKSTTLGLECKSIEVEFQVGSVPRSWDCFAIQLL